MDGDIGAGPLDGDRIGLCAIPAQSPHHRRQVHQGVGGATGGLQHSQRELGELVGATRESVNKNLRTWVDEGVITLNTRTGRVVIHKPDVLENLSGG